MLNRFLGLKIKLLLLIFTSFLITTPVFARITPNDIYQAKLADYQANLAKISDPAKKQSVETANQELKNINRVVTNRFDIDIAKLAAILEEEKARQNITKTVVAYGQGDTPLDTAEYYLNYAAEAQSYQKAQDYTPNISGGNLASGVSISMSNLKSNLEDVQRKITRAKLEINKALNYYEK